MLGGRNVGLHTCTRVPLFLSYMYSTLLLIKVTVTYMYDEKSFNNNSFNYPMDHLNNIKDKILISYVVTSI